MRNTVITTIFPTSLVYKEKNEFTPVEDIRFFFHTFVIDLPKKNLQFTAGIKTTKPLRSKKNLFLHHIALQHYIMHFTENTTIINTEHSQ